jgi:hypothetical protein
MNKDLHDIDNLFRSSLESYEETPSPYVKERLEAALDKRDAESYKKRFLVWKRSAILLFVLLLGFAIFNAGILLTRPENSEKKHAFEKIMQPAPDSQTNEKTDLSITGNKINLPWTHSEGILVNNKSSSDKQYKHLSPTEQTSLADKPSMLYDNRNTSFTNFQQNIPGEDIYAYPLLQKNNPTASITWKAFDPQIDNDAFLKNLAHSENQNKNRIGFRPHWLIGAVFSYEAAGYKLDSDLPNEIRNIKHREVHEPSYSGGVLITRQLTSNWGLQSGLLYSKTEIGIGPQKIYAFLDPTGDVAYKYVTSSGYAYIKPKTGLPPSFGDSVIATEGKHGLSYITVPVSVKYRAGKNKFSFIPGVGIEANFLTGTRVETEIQSPSNKEQVFFNKLYGAKSFYWSLAADAEIRYNMNSKTMISFRPSFHHSISPITENNIVETFPYSFRWGAGLTFKL